MGREEGVEWNKWMRKGGEKEVEGRRDRKERQEGGSESSLPLVLFLSLPPFSQRKRKGDNLLLYL